MIAYLNWERISTELISIKVWRNLKLEKQITSIKPTLWLRNAKKANQDTNNWCKENVNLKREVTRFSDERIIPQLLFLLNNCAIETLLETLIRTGKYLIFHKALGKTSAWWNIQNESLTFQGCFEKLPRTSFEGPSVSRDSLMNIFWWHNCPQRENDYPWVKGN